jgi:hypothetical protein
VTDTPHRTVAELRADYDPGAIPLEGLEFRSPKAGRVLTDPRPVGAGQRPRWLDRHPAGYDQETVVWELPLDDRLRFDIPNGKPRALTLENVVCLFPVEDEAWPDKTEPAAGSGGKSLVPRERR